MVPDGWKELSLDRVFKLTSGVTKPDDVRSEITQTIRYPVYGGNGVLGYSASKSHDGNVIVIGRVGEYCGTTRLVKEPCWITDNALYAKEFYEGNDIAFFTYKLQNYDLSKLRSKGGQPLVSQKPIYSLSFAFPPLPEQKKIAEILSTWDKAIETTEKLLANAEAQKKALMQQLLTGKRRLKGFHGEWKEVRLGDVAKITTGSTPATTKPEYFGGNIPFVTPADLGTVKTVIRTERTLTEAGGAVSRIVPKSSILFSCIGNIGKTGVAGQNLVTNQQINAVTPIKDDPYFIYYLLTFISPRLAAATAKNVVPIVNKTEFSKIKLLLPAVSEQKSISAALWDADREIELFSNKRDSLQTEKKALMQQLLTGKRRVKV